MEQLHIFKKNEELILEISDMGVDGEGIGKIHGIPFFIKDALIGDKVLVKIIKMKKKFGYARLIEIMEPSPYRVEPLCQFHRQCGGCQLQALEYKKQLEFKENKVQNHLKRIGGFTNLYIEPITGMEEPFYYRNKAQFPVGRDKEGNIVTGFYAGRTHNIIPNRSCFLGVKENEKILDVVIGFMEENGISPYDEKTGEGLIRHILVRVGFATGEIMVCIVAAGRKLENVEHLISELCLIKGMKSIYLNVNGKNTNIILGEENILLWGEKYITDKIQDIIYQISPVSFYQVNPIQTEKLYQKVMEYAGLTGDETVWDLYCGIGTISLFLAQKAKMVYGVESVSQAVEDAKENAKINKIGNVAFFEGKVEEVLPDFYENGQGENLQTGENKVEMGKPDVIVVDPPRKGCDVRCLETIVKMQPERMVYVSCDSATLARDLKYLCENGFKVEKVGMFDMFSQTVHVESIVLMTRKHITGEKYHQLKSGK